MRLHQIPKNFNRFHRISRNRIRFHWIDAIGSCEILWDSMEVLMNPFFLQLLKVAVNVVLEGFEQTEHFVKKVIIVQVATLVAVIRYFKEV